MAFLRRLCYSPLREFFPAATRPVPYSDHGSRLRLRSLRRGLLVSGGHRDGGENRTAVADWIKALEFDCGAIAFRYKYPCLNEGRVRSNVKFKYCCLPRRADLHPLCLWTTGPVSPHKEADPVFMSDQTSKRLANPP